MKRKRFTEAQIIGVLKEHELVERFQGSNLITRPS